MALDTFGDHVRERAEILRLPYRDPPAVVRGPQIGPAMVVSAANQRRLLR